MPDQRPPFRACVLIPTYNNPATIGAVVTAARRYIDDILVIDDGSDPEGREAVAALKRACLANVYHRSLNGGKGAAVKTGFILAHNLGYTHVLQIDADGQHDLSQIPVFLAAARETQDAVVIGYPQYSETAPWGRVFARKITNFWVSVETFSYRIKDAMIGFRVYPLDAVRNAARCGDRMDFDIEVVVRLVWENIRIINLPIGVRYLTAEEGGVSHFRMFRDNVRISWLHARLTTFGILRLFAWPFRWNAKR